MRVLYPNAIIADSGEKRGDGVTKDEFARVSLKAKIKPGQANMRAPAFVLFLPDGFWHECVASGIFRRIPDD